MGNAIHVRYPSNIEKYVHFAVTGDDKFDIHSLVSTKKVIKEIDLKVTNVPKDQKMI